MAKQIIVDRNKDGKIALNAPYNEDLVAELKDAVPWQERKWERPNWIVSDKYLETVRKLAAQYAQSEGWELRDYTQAASQEEAQVEKQADTATDYERKVGDCLVALDALFRAADDAGVTTPISVCAWTKERIDIQLLMFSEDGGSLFNQLRQGALNAYKPQVLANFQRKKDWRWTFELPADERVARALAAFSQGKYTSRVKHLKAYRLELIEDFDNHMIAHFRDSNGTLWVGEQFQTASMEDNEYSPVDWALATTGHGVYAVFKVEELVNDFLSVSRSGTPLYFGGAFAVAGPERPSRVAWLLKHTHLEEWFKEWAAGLVASDKLEPGFMTRPPQWHTFEWVHGADTLLGHIGQGGRDGVKALRELLSWDFDTIQQHKERVGRLKEEKVVAILHDYRQRAGELARPILAEKTVADLLKLAQQHGVEVKKSAKKDELVARLAEEQAVAEEVIGLTKRLNEKSKEPMI